MRCYALKQSIANLNSVIEKVGSSNGTLGKLMNDKTLYNNLTNTVRSANILLDDIKVNPKRYVNLNPFRKYKPYKVPSQDPLMDTLEMRYNNYLIKKK